MSANLERLEKNMVKLTITVDSERFEEGMKYSYNKNKSKINIQGFRKGKAPRRIIEVQYGPQIFYDDAVNFVIPDAYTQSIKELNLDIVSKPEIEVEEIKEDGCLIFTAEVAVKPEVTLGQYKGVEIEKINITVEDENVQAELKKVQDKNSRLITVNDRSTQSGDTITIDFEGFIDGVAFEGGKGEDYELVLGSNTFIDTFEEQLVGKNLADDLEINVKFPEDYAKEELAGKPALFKVEIKDIKYKELPELDDEFAKDVSEFDTLDEYKADIKAKLLKQKQEESKQLKDNKVLEKIIENSTMDVPDIMIKEQSQMMVEDQSKRLQSQGLPLDMYLHYIGQTKEQFEESFNTQSEFTIKARLVLSEIAKIENFDVTEEEIDVEIDKMASAYNIEKDKLKQVIAPEDKISLEKDVRVQKALELIVSNSIEI